MSNLSSEERNIYDLVVKRFLSVMMPPFEYLQTNIVTEIAGEKFVAKGKVIKSKGWKALYDREDMEESSEEDGLKDQVLPKLNIGDK